MVIKWLVHTEERLLLLYTVLPEKTAAVGGAMMGSDHVYEISRVSFAIKPYSLFTHTSYFISCSIHSWLASVILIVCKWFWL